ncbi:hypothetical protein PG993_012711 [Apiospora rasikravindrae]|uniref:C2H2-type domain-containing protein n=1 Tax=Apiospora rasikravindrae TaxID=990691 RepID=A0ABR1S378_9PEZI
MTPAHKSAEAARGHEFRIDELTSSRGSESTGTSSPGADLDCHEASTEAISLNPGFSTVFYRPEYCEASSDASKCFALKGFGQTSPEIFDQDSFDPSEWMDFKAYFSHGTKYGDCSFDFEMPMFEIPPASETCSPDSNYDNSPSVVSSIADSPLMGSYAQISSIRKRPQEEPISYDSDSDAESRYSCNKKAKHATDDQLFACPFLKRYPLRHRDCSKYTFKRVRDVKQHLNRNHRTPEFYCARCWNVFLSAKDRDEHARDAKCQVVQQTNRQFFEGVREEQKERLMQNKGHNKSHEEQWFLIWDIVFPGIRRPSSVYRCNPQEEAVVLLREVWNSKQRELLADVTQADSTIHCLMEKLFDRLESESRLPSAPVRKSSKQQAARNPSSADYLNMPTGGTLRLDELADEAPIQFPISPPHEAGYSEFQP